MKLFVLVKHHVPLSLTNRAALPKLAVAKVAQVVQVPAQMIQVIQVLAVAKGVQMIQVLAVAKGVQYSGKQNTDMGVVLRSELLSLPHWLMQRRIANCLELTVKNAQVCSTRIAMGLFSTKCVSQERQFITSHKDLRLVFTQS